MIVNEAPNSVTYPCGPVEAGLAWATGRIYDTAAGCLAERHPSRSFEWSRRSGEIGTTWVTPGYV